MWLRRLGNSSGTRCVGSKTREGGGEGDDAVSPSSCSSVSTLCTLFISLVALEWVIIVYWGRGRVKEKKWPESEVRIKCVRLETQFPKNSIHTSTETITYVQLKPAGALQGPLAAVQLCCCWLDPRGEKCCSPATTAKLCWNSWGISSFTLFVFSQRILR